MNRNMAPLLHMIELSHCILVQRKICGYCDSIDTWANKRDFFSINGDPLTVLMVF